jgi:RHS repeat-associated protein
MFTATTLLTDSLGSTVALTDVGGTVTTEYTYDPFEATSVSGSATANTRAFTGREADGTGLYYYRSRDYDTALHRFVSEDPIGFGGGDANLYAYVSNDPQNAVDPTGELAWLAALPWWGAPVAGGLIGGAVDVGMQLLGNGGKLNCVSKTEAGVAAVVGAALGGLSPGGPLLGAPRLGAPKWIGNINVGRGWLFGWSRHKNRFWPSLRPPTVKGRDRPHHDVPWPVDQALNLEFGSGGGAIGGMGVAGANLHGRKPCR